MRQGRCIAGPAVLLALAGAVVATAGCARQAEPMVVSREALGTVVTVTAYGADDVALASAIEDAFAAMSEVENALDVYDPASAIAAVNAEPYTPFALPTDALEILDAIERLGVEDSFSVTLGSVVALYGFESSSTVPAEADLRLAVEAGRDALYRAGDGRYRLDRLMLNDARLDPGGAAAPTLDFGGAAKGLALDRARDALRASGAVSAALISAGSSTVTLGAKPDGEPWKIGIEDPRAPEAVVAVFTFSGDGAVSTSGDYQRAFTAAGVSYHHILDPASGQPARSLRSLSVGGPGVTGLDTDILSTALFVRGVDGATEYATQRSLGIYAIDASGAPRLITGPGDTPVITELAPPKR